MPTFFKLQVKHFQIQTKCVLSLSFVYHNGYLLTTANPSQIEIDMAQKLRY